MSLQLVQHICDANNIKLALLREDKLADVIGVEAALNNIWGASGAVLYPYKYRRSIKTVYYTRIIVLSNSSYVQSNCPLEIAAWHELGHHMHVFGMTDHSKLLNELSANDWVFQNYKGNFSLGKVANYLRDAILTYIGSCSRCPEMAHAVKAAKALRVHHLIEWY